MERRVLFIIILGFVAFGCSRKAVVHKYYMIETTDTEATKTERGKPLVDAVCEIMPVKIHPAFDGTRIAVRTNSHELAYYARHEWAASPDEALLKLAESGLQHRNLFSHVSGRIAKAIPQYRIQIQIPHLEVIQHEEEEKLSAHLEVEFALIKSVTNRSLVSHIADERAPLKENHLNLFAVEISRLFYEELQRFADKLESYLRSEIYQNSGR